jgi:DNA-binding NarL/FixJ family response regulator
MEEAMMESRSEVVSRDVESSRKPPASVNRLEASSDALLVESGSLGRQRGLFSESRLARKIRREHGKQAAGDDLRGRDEIIDCVIERRLDELIDVGRLTAMEEICFRLHFDGLRARQIASFLGLSHQVVYHRLRSATRRLRRAYVQGPHAGWHEVYLAEVNRYVYRAPKSRLP